jgi:RIO kinase 1
MLQPDTVLSGRFECVARSVDLGGVLREIDDARADEAARRLRMQPIL